MPETSMRRSLLLLLTLSAACSHDLNTPAPELAGIQPNLACNQQITKAITITGVNLTPLPTQSLATEVLNLPVVSLTESAGLDGTPMTGTSVVVPGSGDDPGDVHVRWQSEQMMGFDVFPDLMLAPGIYDLTVANPDNQSATLPGALAIVPPPSVGMVVPPNVCDAQSAQMVTVIGTGFLGVDAATPTVDVLDAAGNVVFSTAMTTLSGCTPIGMRSPALQTCTMLGFTVPEGALPPGTYTLRVTNPADAECSSTESVSFVVEAPPTVTSLAPSTLCQGGGRITVNGTGFMPTPTVALQSGGVSFGGTVSNLNMSGTQLTATFGPGAVPGTSYDLVLTNPDGCYDTPPHHTVTAVPGPIAFLADPEVVYSGVNMRVTVFLTTLTAPLPANPVTIVPTGQTAPVTALAYNTVAGHPNRLQVIVPMGQAAGVYDLMVQDGSGCSAFLAKAITVTNQLTVTLKSITPPFGVTTSNTAVTILRDATAAAPANAPFVATPRAFLNPTNPAASDVAIPLASVGFTDMNTLTAVVPKGTPVHAYDLIVVNPDGTVGVKTNAYTETATPPPVVDSVTPSSIVFQAGQSVTVAGTNFSAGDTISLTCVDANGNPLAAPAVVTGTLSCSGSACTQPATINGSGLPAGSVCTLRVTNADGTYNDYSAIGVTNSSVKLGKPTHAGKALNVGRRALVSSSASATLAARFVYAIGGDGGAAAASTPFSSTEFASVDLFGNMGSWMTQRYTLPSGRSFSGVATIGRYTYVLGGSDGAAAQNSAYRAMTLDPTETPQLDVSDLVLAPSGLGPGYWYYRVSAHFAATDPDNPNGESLASDEFIVKLPALAGQAVQVKLAWAAPVDSLGTPLPNVDGYRIYRSPSANGTSGSELLLATVSGSTLTYTDDGSATPGTETPLPLGSMGQWATLPNLGTARKGLAAAAAPDPVTAGKFYVYALLGEDTSATPVALTSYEYLPVTAQANGHQTVSTWTTGVSASSQGRWQLGAWVANSTVSSTIVAPSTYIYLGGGELANGAAANTVEAGLVAAGGDLGVLSTTPKSFSSSIAGYGVCAANGQLFAFGGAGGSPSAGAKFAQLTTPPPTLTSNSWSDEGVMLLDARYLLGSTVQSAFIFLVAGQTGVSAASTSTETVIW
jgi:hypothetical protein